MLSLESYSILNKESFSYIQLSIETHKITKAYSFYFSSETKIGNFYCKGFGSQVTTIIYASNYVVTIFIKQKH